MNKRMISIILVLVLLLSMIIPIAAEEPGKYLGEAEKLELIQVFKGTDKGFELDREPTRLEGLIMLIRLLGKEEEAQALIAEESVFTDVDSWGVGYTNYAYKNGLTKGKGNNIFGSRDKMDAKMYITFVLRALGYDDSKGDFQYTQALDFAKDQDIISISDFLEIRSNTFLRDHVAKLSIIALKTNVKGKSITLLGKLVEDGAIAKNLAVKIMGEDGEPLEIHFIDVGQADAILIIKGNESMLIDAGGNSSAEDVVNYIKGQNISDLKYVIGTHPHEDHIGGLDNVIDAFNIGKVFMPNKMATTITFEDVIDSIAAKNLKITRPVVVAKYDLNGAQVLILAPNEEKYSNTNNYSIVVKITNGLNTFIFTGDAEKLSEEEMVENNKELLKSDLLKVGHHGSKTSTTQEFLDAVDPKYAVIPVGVNSRYGHPDQEVLDRLQAKNIEIYRTDLLGTIIVTSDGKTITINH